MRKNALVSILSGLVAVFIVIVVGSYVIVAQGTVTGEWKANVNGGRYDIEDAADLAKEKFDKAEKAEKVQKASDPNKIHIQFERRTAHGTNSNGQSYSYSELQGLTRESA
ncbi:MAG: hypothetical protein JO053_04475, partial [Acidobacteria bacterium]|nr:hypothetical protein [Acidobacteriota bacterium]